MSKECCRFLELILKRCKWLLGIICHFSPSSVKSRVTLARLARMKEPSVSVDPHGADTPNAEVAHNGAAYGTWQLLITHDAYSTL